MEFEFIKGYENLYMINRNGEIKSCRHQKIMTPQETEDGYLCVKLSRYENNDKVYHKQRIHRLLALQYIDNPDNKPEIDHIDRNKKNNSLSNLRWVTKQENCNNKDNNICNLTEEQLNERKENKKIYKREWAEKKRRELGVPERKDMNKTKDPDYKNRWDRNKRANETPEERELRLQKRREYYKAKGQTEEQKEKARQRARKQRENKVL